MRVRICAVLCILSLFALPCFALEVDPMSEPLLPGVTVPGVPVSVSVGSRSFSSGPLFAPSIFLPYFLYYQNPGFPTAPVAPGVFCVSRSVYLANDIVVAKRSVDDSVIIVQDYENVSMEENLSWGLSAGVEAGCTLRLVGFTGGFLDPVIERFHATFGFPNGGRECIAQDRVVVDLENDNGVSISQTGNVFSLGDTDLWLKLLITRNETSLWSLLAAIKLPTGLAAHSSIVSTGYPDLGLTLAAERSFGDSFTGYLQTGGTLPGEWLDPALSARPIPFATALLALEYHPAIPGSLVVQLNLKSPVLSGPITTEVFRGVDRLSLPQTDLVVGMVLTTARSRWQFSFTENPLTNMGADISFEVRRTEYLGR